MKKNQTMKSLPKSERPYERCEAQGVSALSDKELLTVLLRSGTPEIRADELALLVLEQCGEDGLSALCRMTRQEMMKLPGIGRVKAIQLQCVCELAKRVASATTIQGEQFLSPEVIFRHYEARLKHEQREKLLLIMLDTKNRLIHDEMISLGTINSSVADPREIFATALHYNAVSIILIHNHPSGDPTPSKDDILTTKRIYEAGKIIGIFLKDHIIIGHNSYISLRADGYLNFLG